MMSMRKSEAFVDMLGHHAACTKGEDAVFWFSSLDEFVWG